MNGGAIAGATIGALAGAGLLLVPVLLAARHKLKKEEKKVKKEEKKHAVPVTETVVTTTSPTGEKTVTPVPAGTAAVVPKGETTEVTPTTKPGAQTVVTEVKEDPGKPKVESKKEVRFHFFTSSHAPTHPTIILSTIHHSHSSSQAPSKVINRLYSCLSHLF